MTAASTPPHVVRGGVCSPEEAAVLAACAAEVLGVARRAPGRADAVPAAYGSLWRRAGVEAARARTRPGRRRRVP